MDNKITRLRPFQILPRPVFSISLTNASVPANLSMLTIGISIIWISPVTSKLLSFNEEENPLGRPLSTVELSIMGSITQTGMVIGPVMLEKIFGKFGSKRSLNAVSLAIILCYVIIAFSRHVYLYFATRFVLGILLGGASVGLAMYISEITEDHNRGKMSCYMGSFIPVGNLYGYVLGSYFSVKIFTLLCTIPSISMVVVSELCLPESPQYLIIKNRRSEALKAVGKLLGPDRSRAEAVTKDIQLTITKTKKDDRNSFVIMFTDRSSRNGFIICSVLSSVSAFTGLPAIMSYLEPVFDKSGTEISGSICAMVVGGVQIICYLVSSILVERVGRRPLCLISSLTSMFPLIIMGIYFYLQSIDSSLVESIKFLPVASVIVLMVTAVTGICSVSQAYVNEVFASDVKAAGISSVCFVSGIAISISVFLFPIMMESIGTAWSFWIFAITCLLGYVFIYFQVPETKGRSLLEIQELLGK